MSGQQFGVFAVWMATTITLGFLVFSMLPALARTIFRARLDSIRDQCMDEVLAGRLTMTAPVEEFLASLDVQNRVARQVTLLRVAAMVQAMRRINTDFTQYHGVSFAEIPPQERKILHRLAERMNFALVRYLVWGSPVGWIIAPLVLWASKRIKRPSPLHVDRIAQDFNRSGAFNDLTERPRLLTRAA